MGNCSSKRHSPGQSHANVTPKKLKDDGNEKNAAWTKDTTESSTTDTDTTLPLTPDASSLPSLLTPSPLSKSSLLSRQVESAPVSPRNNEDVATPLVTYSMSSSSASPDRQKKRPPRTHHNPRLRHLQSSPQRRKGRALQKRLDKARYMQAALSRSEGSYDSDRNSSWDEDEDQEDLGSQASCSTRPNSLPHQYSISSDATARSRASDQLNKEFEATVSKSTVWAEMDLPSKVLSIALSSQKPTLNVPIPSLYLAVGTEDGCVTIAELLEDSPLISIGPLEAGQSTTMHQYARRLGERLSFTLPGQGRVRTLDFSPDCRFLAVGGDDCTCSILELRFDDESSVSNAVNQTTSGDEKELAEVTMATEIPREDRVYSVKFSPDGRYLAVGGFDGTVAIVQLKSAAANGAPEIVAEIPRDGLVYSVDWSPDSRFLAIGSSDKTCGILDVHASWNVLRDIRRPSAVHSVKWYPYTGRHLAIGSFDVAIVDQDSFSVVKEIAVASSNGESKNRVGAMCWSPNGSYFVASDTNKKCTMYEGKTFAPVQELDQLSDVNAMVWGQQTAISGLPRRYLCLGGDDGKVTIIKAGIEVHGGASSFGDDLSSTASSYFSNRGDWVLKEDTFRDMDENVEVTRTEVCAEDSATVVAVAFSRGSRSRPSAYFAFATADGAVTVRSTIDWKTVADFKFPAPIRVLAFSNGSRYLALGCGDSNVYVAETVPSWSVIVKREVSAPVRSMLYSKNNERLAVGTDVGYLHFLNPKRDYLENGVLEDSTSAILCLDWCSKYVAVGRDDGYVDVFDSKKILIDLIAPMATLARRKSVESVAFGASSRFLAVGGSDGHIGIFSSKGGWVLCHQVSGGPLSSHIRWDPIGRYLAFAGARGRFQVIDTIFWNQVEEAGDFISCGKEDEDESVMKDLAFSQDGKWIAFTAPSLGVGVLTTSNWEPVFARNVGNADSFSDIEDV